MNHELPELLAEPATLFNAASPSTSPLIPDEATLQMGIGADSRCGPPDVIDHSNLGIHTEMFSDGVIPADRVRRVERRRQALHPGKLVSGFVLGTKRVRLHRRQPDLRVPPHTYINDPFVIAANAHMVAMNSAIAGGSHRAGVL